MVKSGLFEILVSWFKKTSAKEPNFLEYVALWLLSLWFLITLRFLTSSFTLLFLSIIVLLISIHSQAVWLYYLSITINTVFVTIFIKRFWNWLKEPIFTIDGKLPDEAWYDEQKTRLSRSFAEGQISKIQYNLQQLRLAAQWFLYIQQLKLSIPKDIFQTFTSKVVTTLSFSIISFAIINYSLFLINQKAFFHISADHLSSSIFITFLYYSFATLTTVGYGDIYPIHTVSKLFSILEMLSGVVILVVGLSTLSVHTIARINEARETLKPRSEIQRRNGSAKTDKNQMT